METYEGAPAAYQVENRFGYMGGVQGFCLLPRLQFLNSHPPSGRDIQLEDEQ